MTKTLLFLLIYAKSICSFSQSNIQITEFEAEKYLGKYKIETAQISAEGEITFENANLYFYTEGIQKVKLLPLAEANLFKAENFDIIIQFLIDDFKEIVSAQIRFQGQEFNAKKIKY